MAIANIDKLDNLNEGRVKLNEAIDQANTVQGKLDTIIIDSGTSDAEVIQARGGEPLLYNRLDKVDTQLADSTTKVSKNETDIILASQKADEYILPESFGSYYTKQIAITSNSYAFPTIAKFNGKLYVAFRSGATHGSFDGAIQMRESVDDGITWTGALSSPLTSVGKDFRDPQLMVFNGKLVLRAFYRDAQTSRHLVFMSSADGVTWSPYTVITPPTGFSYAGASGSMIEKDGVLVSTAYTYPHPCSVFVVTTTDLITFNVFMSFDARVYGYGASESTIAYMEGSYRVFCRTSPEDSAPRFTLRLNGTTFNSEYVQQNTGNLDGPRSLAIDDKRTLLSFRDKSVKTRTVLAIADRNGVLEKKIIIQDEGSSDNGYFDLKLDGAIVHGVYYSRSTTTTQYRVVYVRYKLSDIIVPYKTSNSSISTFNNVSLLDKPTTVLVGSTSYTHSTLTKDLSIVTNSTELISSIASIQITLRSPDVNHYLHTIKNVTISGGVLTLEIKIANLQQVISNAAVTLYYTVLYN